MYNLGLLRHEKFEPYATQEGLTRKQWFENVGSVGEFAAPYIGLIIHKED